MRTFIQNKSPAGAERENGAQAMTCKRRPPGFACAASVVLVTFGAVTVPAVFGHARTEPLFLLAWLLAFPLCMRLGFSFSELQEGMFGSMARGLPSITFVLCVGAMVGLWNASGTVAMVTKLCLSSVAPRYFMLMAFLISFGFTMLTGTSFGACGTVGVALMGVGLSMGMDPLAVASPIIGGAVFGDAFSPLSVSPNLAASSAGVDLLKSIRHQATVTVPALIVAGGVFCVWGSCLHSGAADLSPIVSVTEGIGGAYKTGLVALVPLAVVLVMLLMKVPSILSLLAGTAAGFLLSWLYQGHSFRDTVSFMWSGFVLSSDSAFLNRIFSRGGITGMDSAVFMTVLAFGLFGLLSTAGVIDAIMAPLAQKMRSRSAAMLCTVLLGFLANVTSASCNFSYVFVGNLLRPVYEKNGFSRWDLTRSMTVGCLFCGLLIPWNSNPITVCDFLDVAPAQMIPFMFPTYIMFAVLVIVTVAGADRSFRKTARGEDSPDAKE